MFKKGYTKWTARHVQVLDISAQAATKADVVADCLCDTHDCGRGVERRINKYLQKWLGIPSSFTAVGLYIRSDQLPLSCVEFKVVKCRVTMALRESKNKLVSGMEQQGYTVSGEQTRQAG